MNRFLGQVTQADAQGADRGFLDPGCFRKVVFLILEEALARRISEAGGQDARYAASFADAIEGVVAAAREGDMIMTLGAGSVSHLGPAILDKLQTRQEIAQSVR